ncbi:MAG: hypothetical protein WCM76_04990 [Bacteroidota bacterium]
MKNIRYSSVAALLFLLSSSVFSQGVIIPTNNSQADFLKAYKLVLQKSEADYRFSGNVDSLLFPKFGEYSVYWATAGTNRGSFILPEQIPQDYNSVTATNYPNYTWSGADHYSLQFKSWQQPVALFQSSIKQNNLSISWESMYFKNSFDTYLFSNMYYPVDEHSFDNNYLSPNTKMLIIPSFTVNGNDYMSYMDSVLAASPNMKARIDTFLCRGGTIYTEGNAVCLIEKLGYLAQGAVDFSNAVNADPLTNLVAINVSSPTNPISFTTTATGNFLYASSVPLVSPGGAEVVARLATNAAPAIFVLKGPQLHGGRIICNLGLPTVGGNSDILNGSRQLQWTFNTLLYALSNSIDVTRSVDNNLPNGILAGKNAIPYDKVDTFEVRVKVRNLSSVACSGITIKENINAYFSFVDVTTTGITYSFNGSDLIMTGVSLQPYSESVIVYRLKTPSLTSQIHEDIDHYMSWSTYISTSVNTTTYSNSEGKHGYNKTNAYADVMFSADIVADADLNWKNFLGIYYQPFKVFMIMENKERTPAQQTQYVQYIPKDVPFYWVDHSLNVPVLKTPGGKFVDVLKGSDNQGIPDFDISNNGHPDVWLDTASIYPKGYTLIEDSVYWQNPWHRLATGDSVPYYEDIDHDGLRAQDNDNDGIPEVGEPGDKIRVWKVTWNINQVPGHQVYDPFCSYEIWVDPPDLVGMAAGIGHVNGLLTDSVPGMFYPYSPNLNSPNLTDTSWTHWMDRDSTGHIKWTQMIYQSINNYEGYTFIDTAASHYHLLPTDSCVGTVPQPHNEFIAVLSMGGEEIDMNNPTPKRSNYSNIDYKTVFNESKKTPIRTTYTYYAPLPNPLQFEYLTNNFIIKDSLNNVLKTLPAKGKANISFNVDASTEYSYYWIRNAGHDVDYNDPSMAIEGIDKLGDGVFGYMVYDIPKGFSDYKITLPKRNDGSYDMNAIVQVDGHNYQKWLNNPNTQDSISIWEDDFRYHIHIPQLLIPPALCDSNGDGIDDWIDDRGDRFHSQTGYLHDAFMLGDGESYPTGTPNVYPHNDAGMAGQVDQGWSAGNDNIYGNDGFDDLGKVHFTINALYEGKGKEGPVDISKGGWLVVEEIFGGSPWVIFSHTLSAYAEGVDLSIKSSPSPYVVKYGIDTCYVKHVVEDLNEPHRFDGNFDPYHVSYGYGDVSVSTYAGGKDPCSLIDPAVTLPAIIDPVVDHKTLTLVPLADPGNPDLTGFPLSVSGSFIEAIVTVVNGTDDNWIDTKVTPVIPPELGNSHVVMKYVAYPRPLVPAVADPNTGAILHLGDQPGSFTTGWRFNQPDQEVLVKMGDTLNLLQPTRRAYFIFLISVDETLAKGVYSIPFTIAGDKVHYTGIHNGTVNYDVPQLQFSMAEKYPNGNVVQFEKLVIGEGNLKDITINTKPEFKGLQNVKWSVNDVNCTDFSAMTNSLPASYSQGSGQEVIDISSFHNFPSADTSKIFLLEQGQVNTYNAPIAQNLPITSGEQLNFTYSGTNDSVSSGVVHIISNGPRMIITKKIYSVNGKPVGDNDSVSIKPDTKLDVVALISTYNMGSDIAVNTVLDVRHGQAFFVLPDSLPVFCTYSNPVVNAPMGAFTPGQRKDLFIHLRLNERTCDSIFDLMNLISQIDISYSGQFSTQSYSYPDSSFLVFPASDIRLKNLISDKSEVQKGEVMNVTVNAENGAVPVTNVMLRVFSIIGTDTLKIGEMHYDALMAHQAITYTLPYTVTQNAYVVTIYSKIESLDSICEICLENNNRLMRIKVLESPWINDVHASPNPFSKETTFYYELGSDLASVFIDVYTVNGKSVDHIGGCPASIGPHTVTWDASAINSGTYYFRFSGTDADGKTHEYSDKIIHYKQ